MISVGMASSGAASWRQINVALQGRRGACQKDPHEDIVLLPFSYYLLPKQIHPILEKQRCISLLPECLLFISVHQESNKFHTHCERKNTLNWDHWIACLKCPTNLSFHIQTLRYLINISRHARLKEKKKGTTVIFCYISHNFW